MRESLCTQVTIQSILSLTPYVDIEVTVHMYEVSCMIS